MTVEYTRKDREAINRAWSAVMHACECTDWTMAPRMRDALKYERRERSCEAAAKALLAEGFLDGYENPKSRDLSDIYGLSDGIITATIVGAAMAMRHPEAFPGHAIDLSRSAIAVKNAAIHRALDAYHNSAETRGANVDIQA